MTKFKKSVWTGVEQFDGDEVYKQAAQQEFFELPIVEAMSNEDRVEEATQNSSRRDFLKYLGFSVGAATVAASCEIPVRLAVPYDVKPDAIVPGVATYYASTIVQGGDYCPVLVKTREGRPIKVEGNPMSNLTKGGTSARAQAAVLDLYNTARLRGPLALDGKKEMSWKDMDAAVMSKLNSGSRIRILTSTIISPSTKAAIRAFMAKYPNTKHVTYDAVSSSAQLQANEVSFGKKTIPTYKFDAADRVISFNADFLGTWISPIQYAKDYSSRRKVKDANADILRHYQIEPHMSLSGSNADHRIQIRPSEMGLAIATFASALGAGISPSGSFSNPKANAAIRAMAKDALANSGKTLVVSGSNNKAEQLLINKCNAILSSYGNTIDLGTSCYLRQGDDSLTQELVREMKGGQVDALFVYEANPAYELPNAADFASAVKNVGMSVSFNRLPDETTALCTYACPDHHVLEAWGDAQPTDAEYSIIQPTIEPLFNTRAWQLSLLTWAGSSAVPSDYNSDEKANPIRPYYNFIKANGLANGGWDKFLSNGISDSTPYAGGGSYSGDISGLANRISKPSSTSSDGFEVSFYETVNIGGGQYGTNPWLQEMPDPVSRVVWDNYVNVPIHFDGDNRIKGFKNLKYGDMVDVTLGGKEVRIAAVPLFGTLDGTCSIALGYGRSSSGPVADGIGVNMFPYCSIDGDGNTQYYAVNSNVSGKQGKDKNFAYVQHHHTYGVTGSLEGETEVINVDERSLGSTGYQGMLTDRSIFYQTDLSELKEGLTELKEKRDHAEYLNSKTLYPYDEYSEEFFSQGHHWSMSIDLNACTGCGACQVACVAENNVPVVGKQEVSRHHEMTWLRIDRYFYGDVDNPKVVYQPMMCQHCDNAPCENVCPVAATNHSSEGLNQMTYNRCIGTRYCANNCPYKVRRFNWLDYTTADIFPWNESWYDSTINDVEGKNFYADNLTRMVLNPDVTVRSRGVIEKCSFCVQRIQEAKLTAKMDQRPLADGDVVVACQSACPTGAIAFGDINDKDSQVYKDSKNPTSYQVLEEVNLRSSVNYMMKVDNSNKELEA